MRKIFLISFFFILFSFPSFAAKHSLDTLKDPDNYLSVEFIEAPISEIIVLVSEYTGKSFVVSHPQSIKLSWVEKNIYKSSLISSFSKAVSGAGFTIQKIPGRKDLFIIKNKASYVSGSDKTVSYYHLKNIIPDSLEDSAKILYGDSLAINPLEDSNIVLIAGAEKTVLDFTSLLQKIDIPKQTDIESIRLKNISVKAGIKALTDVKVIDDNSFYPDYWNRSIIIKGSEYQRNVASAVLLSIDKPQTGWIDQVEFVQATDTKNIVSVVSATCPGVELRRIGDNRILLSGNESDVNQASALIHKIDGTGIQVKIEAVIAYLTDREYLDIGARLRYVDSHNKYAVNDGLISSLTTANTGILVDFFRNFGLTFAAENDHSHGRIISSPVLIVLNGRKAKIHVGQNVPYISKIDEKSGDDKGTATSVKRKDLGISFSVFPLVDPSSDSVYLTVKQEISSLAPETENSSDTVDVIFNKNEINSTIRVSDGETIFLGGLRSDSDSDAETKIPFLGDIPGLGHLFSYKSDHSDSRHLVVSLRVKILGS